MSGKPTTWDETRLAQLEAIITRLSAASPKGWRAEAAREMGVRITQVETGLAVLRSRGWRAGAAAAAPAAVVQPLPADHPMLRDAERKLKQSQADVRSLRYALDEADAKKTVVEQLVDVVKEEVQPW